MGIRVEHEPSSAAVGMAAYAVGRGAAKARQQKHALDLFQQNKEIEARREGQVRDVQARFAMQERGFDFAADMEDRRHAGDLEILGERDAAARAAEDRARRWELEDRATAERKTEREAMVAGLPPIPDWVDPMISADLRETARKLATGEEDDIPGRTGYLRDWYETTLTDLTRNGVREGSLYYTPEQKRQMARLDDAQSRLAMDPRLTDEQRAAAMKEIQQRRRLVRPQERAMDEEPMSPKEIWEKSTITVDPTTMEYAEPGTPGAVRIPLTAEGLPDFRNAKELLTRGDNSEAKKFEVEADRYTTQIDLWKKIEDIRAKYISDRLGMFNEETGKAINNPQAVMAEANQLFGANPMPPRPAALNYGEQAGAGTPMPGGPAGGAPSGGPPAASEPYTVQAPGEATPVRMPNTLPPGVMPPPGGAAPGGPPGVSDLRRSMEEQLRRSQQSEPASVPTQPGSVAPTTQQRPQVASTSQQPAVGPDAMSKLTEIGKELAPRAKPIPKDKSQLVDSELYIVRDSSGKAYIGQWNATAKKFQVVGALPDTPGTAPAVEAQQPYQDRRPWGGGAM